MNDTHPTIDIQFKRLMRVKSGEERLLMGFSMYKTTKQIVESAIHNQFPEITSDEIKVEIFLRFYSKEFRESQKRRIISSLRRTKR